MFCSKGDNITPPQQALGWILDLYEKDDEIRAYGQTIVYTIHENVGHLGIFVSGGVAEKEHEEFSSNIDLIDVLPPGLYEAVFDPKSARTVNPEMVVGDWIMRCEARTLDDIRAMGGNDPENERRFAAVVACRRSISRSIAPSCSLSSAPVSNRGRGHDAAAASAAAAIRSVFRCQSVDGAGCGAGGAGARASQAVAPDNPFLAMQENVSASDRRGARRLARLPARHWLSGLFLAVYGSPTAASGCSALIPRRRSRCAGRQKARLHQRTHANGASPN